MIKPAFLSSDEQPTILGHVFEAPLVVKGITGLPVLELAAWGIVNLAGRT